MSVLDHDGASVRVIDEVTGDEVSLAMGRAPIRRQRPAALLANRHAWAQLGLYGARREGNDGYTFVVCRTERTEVTYELRRGGVETRITVERRANVMIEPQWCVRTGLLVIRPERDDLILAFDAVTGQPRWTAEASNVVASSAPLGFLGDNVVVCTKSEAGARLAVLSADGSVERTIALATRGIPRLDSARSGVVVAHDGGALFVDVAGSVQPLVDVRLLDASMSVRDDTWCLFEPRSHRVLFGIIGSTPRQLVLREAAGGLLNDELERLSSSRRIHALETGVDSYAFLACSTSVADALIAAGTKLVRLIDVLR